MDDVILDSIPLIRTPESHVATSQAGYAYALQQGFFVADYTIGMHSPIGQQHYSVIDTVKIKSLQKGITRANCMDCVDRCSIFQFAVAKFLIVDIFMCLNATDLPKDLGTKLHAQIDGWISKRQPEYIWPFRRLYTGSANAIAMHSAGTQIYGESMLRYGKLSIFETYIDKLIGLRHLYTNLFLDYQRQNAMDTFFCSTAEEDGIIVRKYLQRRLSNAENSQPWHIWLLRHTWNICGIRFPITSYLDIVQVVFWLVLFFFFERVVGVDPSRLYRRPLSKFPSRHIARQPDEHGATRQRAWVLSTPLTVDTDSLTTTSDDDGDNELRSPWPPESTEFLAA